MLTEKIARERSYPAIMDYPMRHHAVVAEPAVEHR